MRGSLLLLLALCTSAIARPQFQRVLDTERGQYQHISQSTGATYATWSLRQADLLGAREGVGVVRYNAAYDTTWTHVLALAGPTTKVQVLDIVATADGGLVVAGRRVGINFNDTAMVAKFNAAGALLWARSLPPTVIDTWELGSESNITCVGEATNGELFTAGMDNNYKKHAHVSRLSASGSLLWSTSFIPAMDPDSVTDRRVKDVLPLADGSVLVFGSTDGTGEGAWLAHVANGAVDWIKRYDTNDGLRSLQPVRVLPHNNGFALYFDRGQVPAPYFMARVTTDQNGAIIASQLYRTSMGSTSTKDVVPLADGGVVATSSSLLTELELDYNAVLMRLNASGAPQWATAFGTDEEETGASAVPTDDGGFLLCGGAAYMDLSDHRGGVSPRPYLVSTDANGSYTCGISFPVSVGDTTFADGAYTFTSATVNAWTNCSLQLLHHFVPVTVCVPASVAEVQAPVVDVRPNPTTSSFTVVPADARVWTHTLFDAMGHALLVPQRATGPVTMDVRDLAPGRYILRSTAADATRTTSVIVGF